MTTRVRPSPHAGRLRAAGYRAVAIADANRSPLLAAGDVLLVTAAGEAPLALLTEAQRQDADTIAFTGAKRLDVDPSVLIRVDCHDEQAVELAHALIVTALCKAVTGGVTALRAETVEALGADFAAWMPRRFTRGAQAPRSVRE